MTKQTALLQQLLTKIVTKPTKQQQKHTSRGTARKEASSSPLQLNQLRQEMKEVWFRLELACDQIADFRESRST